MASKAAEAGEMSYLSAAAAADIDEKLMGAMGYTLDQLMELAGLSVATATADAFRLPDKNKVFIVCGPGNNGGDGLVAARHLHHFGYEVEVCYPKATPKTIYQNLVTQLQGLRIPISETFPVERLNSFDVIVDAIFGFSFKGQVRAPFDSILAGLKASSVPIVSVDIPSGRHYLGGRFVPPAIRQEYNLVLPAYEGTNMHTIMPPPSACAMQSDASNA